MRQSSKYGHGAAINQSTLIVWYETNTDIQTNVSEHGEHRISNILCMTYICQNHSYVHGRMIHVVHLNTFKLLPQIAPIEYDICSVSEVLRTILCYSTLLDVKYDPYRPQLGVYHVTVLTLLGIKYEPYSHSQVLWSIPCYSTLLDIEYDPYRSPKEYTTLEH